MLVMLFLATSFMGFTQAEWTWSIHPESNFKVLTPFELKHSSTEMPTAYDPIIYHQYNGGSVTDSLLGLALIVDHYTLPEVADSAYQRELFENTIDQILSTIDGDLIYMDYSDLSHRDVCIWKASYLDGKGIIRGNLIIAGDQYYGLQAFGLTKNNPDDLMNKFLDSFKMIN